MYGRRMRLRSAVVGVTLAGVGLGLAAAPAGAATGHMAKKKAPRGLRIDNVATVPGSSDIWTYGIGSYKGNSTFTVQHRHGSKWKTYRFSQTSNKHPFAGLVAASTSTAWLYGNDPSTFRLVIYALHKGKVKSVKLPKTSTDDTINAISGLGLKNVWMVGSSVDSEENTVPAAWHWNGKSWTRTTAPLASGQFYGTMTHLSTTGPHDAVGWYFNQGDRTTTAWQWNDSAWSDLHVPATLPGNPNLPTTLGVAADNKRVYLVGTQQGPGHPFIYAAAESGGTWTKSALPKLTSSTLALSTAPKAAVMAGTTDADDGNGKAYTLTAKNGKWTKKKVPAKGKLSYLYDVEAASGSKIYAVGQYQTGKGSAGGLSRPLLYQFNGHKWKAKSVPA